jgi:hypothetical protein
MTFLFAFWDSPVTQSRTQIETGSGVVEVSPSLGQCLTNGEMVYKGFRKITDQFLN